MGMPCGLKKFIKKEGSLHTVSPGISFEGDLPVVAMELEMKRGRTAIYTSDGDEE